MEFRDLEAFNQLASTLHFAKAAQKLAMSPSALTRRLQALEADLGHTLLSRSGKEVKLTPHGALFLGFARSELERLEQLRNDLRDEEASPTGELLIACTVTACHTVLPTLLARFRQAYPKIILRLYTQDAARSRLQLEAGEVDLAVIPAEESGFSSLASHPLGHTEFALIAPLHGLSSESERATAVDLRALPFIAPPSGLERTRLLSWLAKRDVKPRIVAEVVGNEAMIAMVSLGAGVALIPRLVLDSSPLLHSVLIVTGIELPAGYDVALCARPASLQRRAVGLFWRLARQA
jgi:LysR family transcriptional regulator, positive regulator for ilvC